MKIVYIVSPFRGDTKRNIAKACDYCKAAVRAGVMPIAPHLLYPQFMDDSDREQRKLGLSFALQLLRKCDELWVCGNDITDGMLGEMEAAQDCKIPIRYFDSDGKEVLL